MSPALLNCHHELIAVLAGVPVLMVELLILVIFCKLEITSLSIIQAKNHYIAMIIGLHI